MIQNSRAVFAQTKEDPVDPPLAQDGTSDSRNSFGKKGWNAYKPGFIDTTTTEAMKMAIDRELGELSKAFFQSGENTTELVRELTGGSSDALAQIKEELRILAEEGRALAEKVTTLTAQVNDNTAQIKETYRVIADLESALAEKITALEVSVGNNKAAITEETRVRADADSALAERITQMGVQVGNNSAAITEESRVRADQDGILAERITKIEGEVGTDVSQLVGKIEEETRLRISADEALGERISSIDVKYQGITGENAAAIRNEEQARVTADEAMARRADSMVAEYQQGISNNSASIQNEAIARSNADEALAQRSSIMEAQLSGDTTNLFTEPNFDSDEHGLKNVGVRRNRDYPYGMAPQSPTYWCLEVNGRDNMGKTIKVTPGDRHYFSMYCATDNATAPPITIGLRLDGTAGTSWVGAVKTSGGPHGWHRIEGSVTIPDGYDKAQFWVQLDYSSNTSYWMITGIKWQNTSSESSINARIQREEEVRATQDEALARTAERIEAEYKSADNALQGGINGANQGVTEAKAAIQRESEARASADEALARESSRIEAEYKAADSSLQGGINGANQGVTEAKAAITAEAEARANADGAMAGRVDGVEANFNGQIASVNQFAQATADRVGNVEGKWGVTINANGSVSGIELNNGTGGSAFKIQADRFIFTDAGGTTSSGFSSSGGVTTFHGDVIARTFQGLTYCLGSLGDINSYKETSEANWVLAATVYLYGQTVNNVDQNEYGMVSGVIPVQVQGNALIGTRVETYGSGIPYGSMEPCSKIYSGNWSIQWIPFRWYGKLSTIDAAHRLFVYVAVGRNADYGFGGGKIRLDQDIANGMSGGQYLNATVSYG